MTPWESEVVEASKDGHLNEENDNTVPSGDTTPLLLAPECRVSAVDSVRLSKVDLNVDYGLTPMMVAAEQGSTEIVSILLREGCNVNEQHSVDGRTALHFAAGGKQLHTVEFLLSHGADVDIRDKEGLKPLDKACNAQDFKTAAVLLDHGAEPGDFWEKLKKSPADNPFETHPNCFDKHFIKMVTIGQVSDKNTSVEELRRLEGWNSECDAYRRDCLEEIDRLQSRIGKTNVTYYDILSKKTEAVTNSSIEQILSQDNYVERFPIYGGMIKIGFDSSRRWHLVERSAVLLRSCFPTELPVKLVRQICSHLNDFDLEAVTKAYDELPLDSLNEERPSMLESGFKGNIHQRSTNGEALNGAIDGPSEECSWPMLVDGEETVCTTASGDTGISIPANDVTTEVCCGRTITINSRSKWCRFLALPAAYLVAGLSVGAAAHIVWPTH